MCLQDIKIAKHYQPSSQNLSVTPGAPMVVVEKDNPARRVIQASIITVPMASGNTLVGPAANLIVDVGGTEIVLAQLSSYHPNATIDYDMYGQVMCGLLRLRQLSADTNTDVSIITLSLTETEESIEQE